MAAAETETINRRSESDMSEAEQAKLAFETASHLVMILIAMSALIVFVTGVYSYSRLGWSFYLISMLCGLGVLMAMVGTISKPPSGEFTAVSLYEPNITNWARLQMVSFVLASILAAWRRRKRKVAEA